MRPQEIVPELASHLQQLPEIAQDCREIDYELVIIDDNSQDNTQGVVRQLQQLYGEDRIVIA